MIYDYKEIRRSHLLQKSYIRYMCYDYKEIRTSHLLEKCYIRYIYHISYLSTFNTFIAYVRLITYTLIQENTLKHVDFSSL